MDTPQSYCHLQTAQNPLAKKYDMKHVKYCLLGAQVFPLELIDDLAKVFPNCTLGQAYGKSRALLESRRRSNLQSAQGSRKCRRRWQ